MSHPQTSVILLTLNESANIGACIEAIRRQEVDSHVEIVLIDSGSTDGTVDIASRFVDQVIQIPQEEFHHARTRNLGARRAQGEVLVYLAGDALPVGIHWLASLLRHFSDAEVAAVFGRQIPRPGASIERRMLFEHRYPPRPRMLSGRATDGSNPSQAYHFSTVNAAIRRSVWAASPFPEICKTYEDVGMAKQILEQGRKIMYEPEAAVIHSHNYTLGQGLRRSFDVGVIFNQLGLWNAQAKAGFRRDGTRRALHELGMALARGEWAGAAYLACFDFARYAGILLGRNERRLPHAFKKRMSFARIFG
ncbi:MAG TPA: glycosyltransferase family 2 protein [Terriglobia bacterium]|nr:glycosyltransferase family 2 protein [Terriglobia bacterium]